MGGYGSGKNCGGAGATVRGEGAAGGECAEVQVKGEPMKKSYFHTF
jgi:hypothetical protein